MSSQASIQQLRNAFVAIVRNDAVVEASITKLQRKIRELCLVVERIFTSIRASSDGKKDAQLLELGQILTILRYGDTKGSQFYRAMPFLYLALEMTPMAQGKLYQIDSTIRLTVGDNYQVAARIKVIIQWLHHQVKSDLDLVLRGLGNQDSSPHDLRDFLSQVKRMLMTLLLQADHEEMMKIREIWVTAPQMLCAHEILRTIGAW